ncbi:hypothetical protein PRZ48_012060 [Zasmidium cellare]|uniref:VOC domain-containing protein n=1 Tax=Zasmidium cellare TaxID=395010 RepID=A0ABR0E3S9_ZASCE|nr:hypothetical protein PRZ48_012060 [Zasmidium cellare]
MGIHHLKFAVSNLDVSIAWYERVLGGRRIPGLDHTRQDGTRFAAILEMVDWGGIYLELRQTMPRAVKDRGWDPVTLTAKGREDLVKWVEWLEKGGTLHSAVLVGKRGWILVFEDPDGRRFRIYTREHHAGKEEPSNDPYWLGECS